MTLLLSRSDLTSLLDPRGCLDALADGFASDPAAIRPQRVHAELTGPGTATTLIPGLLDGIPAYTVKVNAKFPAARPALRGVVCLHDMGTGELLALLDSAAVTAWRTGLSAALGTDLLARSDADTVAVIGAGAQAEHVVQGLTTLRTLRELVVVDQDRERAAEFAARWRRDLATTTAGSAREAAHGADIVVVATWSREPLLWAADIRPGNHVTSLGSDEPGKVELAANLLRGARVFVDDVALSLAAGALGNAGLTESDAAAILSDVVRGDAVGRRDEREITVYAPIGLPWQDLALAWAAYGQALEAGAGSAYDFLA